MSDEDTTWKNPVPFQLSQDDENALKLHWSGYVADPGPTNTARASGKSVHIYGDNGNCDLNLYASKSIILRPTAYPGVPEFWSEWFVQEAREDRRPELLGTKEAGFITDGSFAARLTKIQWMKASKAGVRCRPGKVEIPAISGKLYSITTDFKTHNPGPNACVKIGGEMLATRYLNLFRRLGHKKVKILVADVDDIRFVAKDIVVMGMRR